jgi:chromate transporter
LTEGWVRPGPIRDLVLYFLRLGLLGFGGPVALVGQMERELVGERGWLTKEQMREAIAVCQSLPGPLAIQVGIFLPSFMLVLVAAPVLQRHRANRNVQGFVKGAYAAAFGTILGASVLLGRIAIGDWLTILIGVASLGVLFRWKVSNPLLMAAAAAIGLIAFPLLHPAWVMVR